MQHPDGEPSRDMTPSPASDGPALEFDSPAFEGGVAEYAAEPTGCTVFHFPTGAALAIDVRGSLAYMGDYGSTHAICLESGRFSGHQAARDPHDATLCRPSTMVKRCPGPAVRYRDIRVSALHDSCAWVGVPHQQTG